MKKSLFLPVLLLLCITISGCGNLTNLSRHLLLEETPSSSFSKTPASSLAADAAPSESSPDMPLYEAYSYVFPTFTEKERIIFLALYEGIMAFQKEIPLPFWAEEQEVTDMMTFIFSECPELLQVGSSWAQRSNLFGYVTAVMPTYTITETDYAVQKEQVETLLSQFHTQLAGADPYQIELTLVNYIIDHCWYSLEAPNCQNAYGALIEGAAKCDGRAKALVWGLRSFGIKASVMTGSNHAWVIAQINGYHYNVDPTYDDNDLYGTQRPPSYTYFNVPESAIAASPYPADEIFIRRGYPATVHWDHNYHVQTGLWISAGQSAETAFYAQLEEAIAAKQGCIRLRFESAADYETVQSQSRSWIQSYVDHRGLQCNITTYDYSKHNVLFLQLTFFE